MKIGDFFKSKRTWTIFALAAAQALQVASPEKYQGLSAILGAIFGAGQ